MKMVRSVTASAIATAMLATSATPAAAQVYGGGSYGNYGYGGGYGRHHDRGVNAGDIIAGVAIIGVIAAIASAASGSSRNRYRGNINSEGQAADACASRIEQRYDARVSNINNVYRTRDGYDVRGTIETRDGRYGDRNQGQQFTCSVRYGQVEDVRVDGGYAYRGY